MATSSKSQKDKPQNVTWLMPRPTAASAARAAHNATNRNLVSPVMQRQSPARLSTQISPITKRKFPVNQRNLQAADSITDTSSFQIQQPTEPSVESNSSVLLIEGISEDCIEKNAIELQHAESIPTENESQNDNEAEVIDPVIQSRPVTPALSRPQTPNSVLSRPPTPHAPSRPPTPAHLPPVARPSTPASRPSTPQRRLPIALPGRPATPLSNLPTLKDEGDMMSTYSAKQQQFHLMKKELDLKQQAILEVFDSLRELRERMSREGVTGGGEGRPQELVVFNVADWTADEVAQLCRDAAAASNTDGAVEFVDGAVTVDEGALDELDSKVQEIPSRFADLCLQALTARQELIDWIKELLGNNISQQGDGGGESLDRIARYNSQGLELCEALRDLKVKADNAVDSVTQISKRICREQGALVSVGKSLVREVARLRQNLEPRPAIICEMHELRADTESTKALEDARQELEEEKAARLATKDKLSTAEAQLRQTRMRVSKMDRQLREADASIASLTGTVKTLEDQSRQREVQLEARARKLKESLKTGEVASGQLANKRDALQAEVTELRERIESMTTQHKSTIMDLNGQLKELRAGLEDQHQLTQTEEDLRHALEASLTQSQSTIDDLKAKIVELENSRPNSDLPTEREMDLWAELQATKETLRMTEDEVTTCKREKVRFLETLTKIAESDNKVGMQQKLAAELLSKEEILSKMQIQVRELTKNIKLNEQKVIQYEQYVHDLQAHNRAVANHQEAPDGISYQDLQQEIMNLRMNLLEAVHRNEELSETLVQKEQQLEQQDKTSRAQARVIKVREELINMLKNKETEQSRELSALQQDLEHRMKIVEEVNKQIAAKADEIQELFSTLENKQQQIHRLEKIVLALEEQQRRAQAQRTRHEEKIAALEHELAAGGNRRERKFLFF